MPLLTTSLLSTFLLYKYSALFVITVIEGPLITMLAGYFVSKGLINFWLAYPLIVVADLCSDSFFYALGYWGRLKIVKRFSGFMKASIPTSNRMQSLFQKHVIRTLFIAKITHAAGMPFLVGAGLAKVKYKKFLFANFLATLPKSMTFIIVGYYYGQAASAISKYLAYGTWAVLGLMMVTIFVYVLVGRHMYRKMLKEKVLSENGDATQKNL